MHGDTRQFDLDAALRGLKGRGKALLIAHNNPDPDSIAAAEGMKTLLQSEAGLECSIGYGGIVGRAENRAMVNLLNIDMQPLKRLQLSSFDIVGLVDSQPGAGNNSLPDGRIPDIVVDHHPGKPLPEGIAWADIRTGAGATTTIVHGYLKERGLALDGRLATILLYGISTDTMDLGRGAGKAEIDAYLDLLPACDLAALSKVRLPHLSFKYFKALTEAIESASVFGKDVVAVTLPDAPYPEIPAEIADMLVRAQGMHVSFCAGLFGDDIYLSVRVSGKEGTNAGDLIRKVAQSLGHVGGHSHMAGGVIEMVPRDNAVELGASLTRRLCSFLGVDSEPRRFIDLA